MHLAALADLSDVAIVRDESVSARPTSRSRQCQPPRHDRPQSVRPDDESGGEHLPVHRPHAAYAAGCIAYHVHDMCRFANVRARIAGSVEQDGVENLATHGETAVAKPLHATSSKLADDANTVRRADHHTGKLRSAVALDCLEHANRRQHERRLRTHIIRARLGTRESRPYERIY